MYINLFGRLDFMSKRSAPAPLPVAVTRHGPRVSTLSALSGCCAHDWRGCGAHCGWLRSAPRDNTAAAAAAVAAAAAAAAGLQG